MTGQPSVIALVPARSESRRLPDKNIRPLAGHPLIAYSIAAAAESGIFSAVVVSTDSEYIASVARYYGADVPFLRPAELARDLSPDIEWVEHTLRQLKEENRIYDCFSILRPTSPFRQAATIRRAWDQFVREKGVDSLRAVEKCKQHPGKMWVVRGNRMMPLLPLGPADQPWHSTPYQALPKVYVQNASIEIAWSRVVSEQRTIAGDIIMPFFPEGLEGFDINDGHDLALAKILVESKEAALPPVSKPPWES